MKKIFLLSLSVIISLSLRADQRPQTSEDYLEKLRQLKSQGSSKAAEALRRLETYGLVSSQPKPPISLPTAQIYSPTVEEQTKKELQQKLRRQYMSKLEEKWGECEGKSPSDCLTTQENYMWLELPNKKLCFPYTMCGFYQCMEEEYQCSDVGNIYFTELAHPTCLSYQDNIQKERFSNDGIKWIYEVMVCLQKGLIDECEVRGECQKQTKEKTCDYITEYTLDFHPSCYINSHVGVCQLPFQDRVNIWRTVGPYLTSRERVQAFKVVLHCLGFDPF